MKQFEMKSRIFMAKAAFSKRKASFLQQRKKLVNLYIWGIGLYSAGTGKFGK
jgi:hypothetical protein